jgi:T5SS/PEP-CTERM-associated repeat protein
VVHKPFERRAIGKFAAVLFSAPLFLGNSAQGDTTWVGNAPILGPTTLWTAPGNWSNGTLPPAGDNVIFGSGFSSGQQINILTDQHVGNFTVDTSVPFNIVNTGTISTLYFTNLLRTAASSGTQTISAPIGVSGNQSWSIDGTGGMAITGPISTSGASRVDVSLGSLSLGASGVESNMYHLGVVSGVVALNGGKLTLHSTDIDASFAALRVGGLSTPADFTVQNGAILASGANTHAYIESNMTVSGTGSQWQFPFLTYVGVLQDGQLTVQSGGSLSPSSGGSYLIAGLYAPGTITVKSGGSLNTTSSMISYVAGAPASASVTGTGSSWTCANRLDLGGYEDMDGVVTGQPGKIVTGDTGTLTISDHATVTTPFTQIWTSASSITINGGSLNTGLLRGSGTVALQADPAGGSALNITDNSPDKFESFSGKITGPGTIHKSGASKQQLGPGNKFGGVIVDGGTLSITSEEQMASVAIGGTPTNPTARLQFGLVLLTITNSLNGTPVSDTNKDALVIARGLAGAGYAGGANTGNGFQSAEAYQTRGRKLAYERMIDRKNDGGQIDPNLPLGTLVLFNTVDGDANMDNEVSFADLVKVAQNYGQSNRFWTDGDFNYDGIVSFADLVSVAQNYGHALPGAPVPGASAQFNADMAQAFAEVPEPGVSGLIAVAGFLMGRRRRRR